MKEKAKRKIEWNRMITITVRILFIMEFFAPIGIWLFTRISQVETEIKFINMFTAILGFFLTFIPEAVDRISKHRLRMSSVMSVAIVLFIFGAEFLGEIKNFYYIIPWWDTMLHSISGVILGLIGFMLVFILNENENTKVKLSPIFICFFAFCFALACGALWEIFEFSGDRLLHMNMQKYLPPEGVNTLYAPNWRFDEGLIDTMGDIICDAVAAFATSLFGFILLSVRAKKEGKTLHQNLSEQDIEKILADKKTAASPKEKYEK